ncbi:UNVERIFIED_CONTAM: hypothetical protein GTU68_028284 [Idotea baltica]|nr:hypothetical protein [Idotea baltica]
MNRLNLGDSLQLSQVVYGMWRLGDDKDTSAAHVQTKIEACLDQGITSFDQADIYGDYESESILGAALKAVPELRNRMEIITKCDIMLLSDKYAKRTVKYYDTSAAHINASVDKSLANMSIDHIDLLLLHRPDPLMDHAETGDALDKLIKSGKVRGVGVSNFRSHDWDLLQSGMSSPLLTNQLEISLLSSELLVDGTVADLQRQGIHPMAWSPLGGGALFDSSNSKTAALQNALKVIADEQSVDMSAVAVAWLLKHPSGILPVMGTNNLDRIKALAQATSVELSREQWFVLYEAANGHEVA